MKKKNLKSNKHGLKVLPGQGKRFSFQSIRQAMVFYLLLLIALVVVVQVGYHWLGDQFLAWRLQVVEAEPGVLEQETSARGYITRVEEVMTAPSDGMILSLARAGERVPAGNELATLGVLSAGDLQALLGSEEEEPDEELRKKLLANWQDLVPAEQEAGTGPETAEEEAGPDGYEAENSDQDEESSAAVEENIALPSGSLFEELIVIQNEQAGFISHYFDGWEDYQGPLFTKGEETEENGPKGFFIVEGDVVKEGEPILKIVDNWHWYFSVTLPLHPGRIVAGLETVEIEFDFAPQQTVSARRDQYEIDEEEREVRIFYIIEKQLPGFDQARQTEASLLYRRRQGIIVPAEALLEKDQHIGSGVYLNQGGRVVFQPVTVIERQGEKVMVEGLAPYSMVISRPDLVEEGQRLN